MINFWMIASVKVVAMVKKQLQMQFQIISSYIDIVYSSFATSAPENKP